MAKIRKWVAYRRLERPYTRVSKYRKKAYIRITPHITIARFNMGNTKKKFPIYLHLISKEDLQIRQNALDAARMTCNKLLESVLTPNNYHLLIRTYPHHVLRENPLASGAGADRMSTGMSAAFGKPIGMAARIKEGDEIFTVGVENDAAIKTASEALRKARTKLPKGCTIVIERIANKK
jgi:large subunit ribosomal protein L10e